MQFTHDLYVFHALKFILMFFVYISYGCLTLEPFVVHFSYVSYAYISIKLSLCSLPMDMLHNLACDGH
jgi:hypothetical protein